MFEAHRIEHTNGIIWIWVKMQTQETAIQKEKTNRKHIKTSNMRQTNGTTKEIYKHFVGFYLFFLSNFTFSSAFLFSFLFLSHSFSILSFYLQFISDLFVLFFEWLWVCTEKLPTLSMIRLVGTLYRCVLHGQRQPAYIDISALFQCFEDTFLLIGGSVF